MNFQKFNLICVQFTIIENKLFEFLVFSLKTQNVNSRLEKKKSGRANTIFKPLKSKSERLKSKVMIVILICTISGTISAKCTFEICTAKPKFETLQSINSQSLSIIDPAPEKKSNLLDRLLDRIRIFNSAQLSIQQRRKNVTGPLLLLVSLFASYGTGFAFGPAFARDKPGPGSSTLDFGMEFSAIDAWAGLLSGRKKYTKSPTHFVYFKFCNSSNECFKIKMGGRFK